MFREEKQTDMEHDKRIALEQRRKTLQLKMQAEKYIQDYISPSKEIFDYLHQQKIKHEVAGLVYTPVEHLPYLEQLIAQPPYPDYGFRPAHLQNTALETLLGTLDERFPSANPLRYVPDLTEYANYYGTPPEQTERDGLKKARQALGLREQNVYLYYPHHTLVLNLSLDALCAHDDEDLFSTWIGEALIFSGELDWLIAFTLEEEWLGGKR